MILHFQKQINVIMYIIEKKKKTLIISFGQNLNEFSKFMFIKGLK
jgi:hypothetical protein